MPFRAGHTSVPDLLMKFMLHRPFYVLTALLFLMANAGWAAESADELVDKAKVFDRKFQPKEALPLYLEAEKLEPKNRDILVRIARQYRHLMNGASAKQEKLRLGYLALQYSDRAAAMDKDDAEAQLAPAITLGKMMTYMPTKEQVNASRRIKESVDKALALDPKNDNAWHILGRWHRTLADVGTMKRYVAGMLFMGKLPVGSNEEAERAMKKAIELNPNRCMHYIELGRIYAQMGRKDDARKYINKGLAMPDTDIDDVETKQRGRETLQKLK